MYRKLSFTMIIIFNMTISTIIYMILFFSNAFAGETPAEFAFLDLSLEIDPAVEDFRGDVSIAMKSAVSDRQYQYVFRHSQNYILPDNPIKVIADTYNVETYIHNVTGVSIAGADGGPVNEITIPTAGAALVLRVINNAASITADQPAGEGDINSLVPVMDSFYENTAHAVNGGAVKRLELWTSGTTRERFLKDPNHTQEQWDGLSLYERANYLALTIIPFDMLFTYKSVEINTNDKTSFTKPLLGDIYYLRVASTDGGIYYGEICKVIDWIWDYYVQNRSFVNVIDEYEKMKMDSSEVTNIAEEDPNVDDVNINAGGEPAAQVSTLSSNTPAEESPAQTPAAAANIEVPVQYNQNDATAVSQIKLAEKIKNNLVPILIAVILALMFLGLRQWNRNRIFQSEENLDREN